MATATWLVYDTPTQPQEITERIGVWCNLCDGSGPGWEWGPIYEWLGAPGGAKYACQVDRTLFQDGLGLSIPKLWNTDATLQNNPKGVIANSGDPLFSAEELTHLAEVLVDAEHFVEHIYT